jgi:hypothetical protein
MLQFGLQTGSSVVHKKSQETEDGKEIQQLQPLKSLKSSN